MQPESNTTRSRLNSQHYSLHGNNDAGGQTASLFGQDGKVGKRHKRPRLIGRPGVRHKCCGIRVDRPQRPFNGFANRIQHFLCGFLKGRFKMFLFAVGCVKVDRCALNR